MDPAEQPLLVSEPAANPKEQRAKLAELLFEKLQAPALFLARAPVLAAFAAGRPTALVVDVGAGKTTVAAVYDGYVLNKGRR